MKRIGLFVLFSLMFVNPVFAGDYILHMDGRDYELNLGKKELISLPDGSLMAVTLEPVRILEFQGESFSFSYASTLTPVEAGFGSEVELRMSTASGSMISIREYEIVNRTLFLEIFMEAMEGTLLAAGYEIKTEQARKILSDGTELEGRVCVSALKDVEYTNEIYMFSGKKSCLLILTEMERENAEKDRKVLDLFWESLKITIE